MSEPAVDIAPAEVGLDPADAMALAAKEAHEREMMGEMPQDAVQLSHHEVRMSVLHLDLFYGNHQARGCAPFTGDARRPGPAISCTDWGSSIRGTS